MKKSMRFVKMLAAAMALCMFVLSIGTVDVLAMKEFPDHPGDWEDMCPDGSGWCYYASASNDDDSKYFYWFRHSEKLTFTSSDDVDYEIPIVWSAKFDFKDNKFNQVEGSAGYTVLKYRKITTEEAGLSDGILTAGDYKYTPQDVYSKSGYAFDELVLPAIYGKSSAELDSLIRNGDRYKEYFWGLKRGPSRKVEDKDTYKSKLPAKSIFASDGTSGSDGSFVDLKAHEMTQKDSINQSLLAQSFASLEGKTAKVVIEYSVYPNRDLKIEENGSKMTLTWTNVPAKEGENVFAVGYNQIDGAYYMKSFVDKEKKAQFSDFKLRPASNVTLFTCE